ncbi:MAG: LysE family transporter [Clostridiaceae bacterium]|jgi:threonine/homoserine/homoserine lactone efflux protein|nr:LysE family transporter [Clostridiaceae bacterium]
MLFLLFISAFIVGLSGAMMPGSLLTYTIRKSLSAGPRAGFIIVLGHALLEFALVVVIFLGFDVVLKAEPIQIGIGIIGGILLAWMGTDMIINAAKKKISVQVNPDETRPGSMVLSGVIISAANPYFLLWWAIIGLGFIMQSYETFGLAGVIVYYLGHITADVGWYGLISIIVGKTRKFIKEKPYRIIVAILGVLLIFFGGKFVFDAIKALTTYA